MIEDDLRTLGKWLNEEPLAPIDRQALARVLAHKQPTPIDKSVARRIATQLGWEPPRKPLTDEEVEAIGEMVANAPLVGIVPNFRVRLARAIEAAHDIKEAS